MMKKKIISIKLNIQINGGQGGGSGWVGGWQEEHPHGSRGREDVIGCFQEGGKLGKGITFGM